MNREAGVAPLPCYTRLAPFAKWFRQGTPVLMYHKLGPQPAGVRLKGLYIGDRLFRRQLRELAAAGFTTPDFAEILRSEPAHRRVFLSFDDGFENALRHGLKPLAESGLRAIQFLVADRLGQTNDWETRDGEAEERLMDVTQVREWLAAGHEIGAHTLTHPRLTQIPAAQAREEISASRRKLEDLFSRPVTHFAYPFGDYDERVVSQVREAGFATACTVQGGLVTERSDPFRLNRLMARYASRSPRSMLQQLKARWRSW